MIKSKAYTFLKMFIFALFIASFIALVVACAKYLPENIDPVKKPFMLMMGFISLFLSLEGGGKMIYRDWFLYSPEEPYTWDEKIIYPIKFLFCGILWIIVNIIAYVTVASIFTAGPFFLAITIFSDNTTKALLSTSGLLIVLIIVVSYANDRYLRKKML